MQASRFDSTRRSWRRALANHFRPPQFPGDELKTRRAALLNVGLLGAIVFYAVVLGTAQFISNPSPWLVLILLLSLGACILLYGSLRRGFLTLASVGIVTLSIASATLGIALTGEFRPPATAGYLAIVVIAGLLFDRRGIFLTAAACSGATLLLLGAQAAGLFPAPVPENKFQQWLLFTGLLLVVGTLSFISGRLVRDALARANQELNERKRAEQITLARARLLQESFSRDWRDILQLVLDEAEALTDSCIGFFHFLESDETTLVLQNWSTRTKHEFCHATGAGLHYPVETAGVWADCVRECRPIIYNAYDTLPNRKGMPPGHAVVERFIAIPIFRADAIVGIIGVGNAPYDYTPQDEETIRQLADLTWDIVERKRAQAALEHLSTHDVLTGVCNRAFFEAELARLEHSREYPISILVADLDDLKWTNDTYGHAVGDALLRRAAQALSSAFRASDILARIGGDEFALLLPNTDAESAQHILARVQANLAAHNATATDIPLSLSLGIATSENGNLLDMLRRADAAMYLDKRAHKIARGHEIPA